MKNKILRSSKNKISGYILRSSAAELLFSCVVVALSSVINLSNYPQKFPTSHNNTAFGVNGHQSAASVAAPPVRRNRTLTFADRVAYQRAIEDVYWRHRIWPKENPDPKPSLDAVMPQAQIQKKVEDYLRNSQALEECWQQPLTAEQLQAEMDRIAANTRRPEMLRELFDALGNDPVVIAECLARPTLAERLLTSCGSRDQRFHGAIPQQQLETQHATAESCIWKVIAAAPANYSLPTIPEGAGCTDDTWTATTTTNAPDARYGHTALWTGSEMIVWGGTNATNFFDTGGRYDPATDSWTATSTTNAPSARDEFTAIWTGSEMIVWGGAVNTNTGGRYNPSTDTWTATSTTNAPSARDSHTAVWTGSEMIIWGGDGNSGTPLNTGGRYDPATDTWTVTSTVDAPDARWAHTAVWTGSEIIVWGGFVPPSFTNTGGRYNPSTDSWVATSTTSAPSARAVQTALWTDSEMIVWGGSNGFPVTGPGGRYDPATDTWTATSTTNAPSARDSHTAVWTGSEMIVWGGHNIMDMSVNTGGRYNPITDIWTPTSTSSAPEARLLHTAVWTGSEIKMIVWGGSHEYPGILYYNDGGRYCAQSGPIPTPTPTASPRVTPTPRSRPTPAPRP